MGTFDIRRAGLRLIACLLALTPLSLEAQPMVMPEAARPWAAGVADDEQAKALALYVAGNQEFTESHFAQALAMYREAIQHWDHPAIRYNMAVCLINLDQPVEARAALERGLRYGAAPVGNSEYARGLTYRKLLDAQLVRVQIACPHPGAEVRLDGKLVITGPGVTEQFLTPGTHQMVATARGFMTVSRTFARAGGEHATFEIEPARVPTLASHAERRWAVWKPWALVGAGGAAVGLGAVSSWRAGRNFARYDDGISSQCPSGCDAKTLAGLTDLRHSKDVAGQQQLLAVSLFATGGAAMLAGAIGLVLNQPRLRLAPTSTIAVAWLPGGMTVSLGWRR